MENGSMVGEVIVAERLTKSYGKQRGIVDLSFAVHRGEIFGYLGPNGAGKTTTIRTLLDFIRPTSGRATVLGFDTHRASVEVRRRTGYLPGELALYEKLTGAEYLHYMGSLRGGVDWPGTLELADRLGVDLRRRIRTLSHGNRQKVGLVQAFMHRPELLILDEPTAGLDPLVQKEFHDLIAEVRAQGVTVLLSSHVLPEVERVCDRVAIIREGRLVAVEDVGDLKAKQTRTVDLHFVRPVPVEAFAGLPGVREATAQGDSIHLTVTGAMDAVVKAAARFEIVDLVSHEPSLGDVFMAFYEGKETDAA